MNVTTNIKITWPICFGCKLIINEPSFLSVTPGTHWHDECLRCCMCKEKLDEQTTCFMDRHGFPYCKHDYPRRLYYQCFACQKNLLSDDLIQRAKSNVYHVDCFRCEACRKRLQTGDEFALNDNRIFCRNDYDSLLTQPLQTTINTDDKLKIVDSQKLMNSTNIILKHETLINSEITKVNTNENNNTRHSSLLQRKKSSRTSTTTTANKINSLSMDELDGTNSLLDNSSNDRHKSTDDSSSQSPNSSQQQSTIGSAERRPRRDKQQRVRTVLTEKQLHLLKSCYAYNARPDALLKEQLAEMTDLSPRVIRVWFQNKRCKDKKKTVAQQGRYQGEHKRHRLDLPLGPNGESFLLGHPMSVLSPCNSQGAGGGPSSVNGGANHYEPGPMSTLPPVGAVNPNGPFLTSREGLMYTLASPPPSNSDDSYVMGPHGPLPTMSCPGEWVEHHGPLPNEFQPTMPMYHPVNLSEEDLEDQDMMMPLEDDSLDQTNSDFSDS